MGARQSGNPRSVNMDNQTPIGVIDVSDEVVQRLKNGLTKGNQTQKIPTATTPTSSSTATLSSSSSSSSTNPAPNTYNNPYSSQHGGHHHHNHHSLYNESTMSSMDVRRQKDIELQQNDIYWRKRLQQLEQTLNKTNSIMEKEYSMAIDDVRTSFTNAPSIHQLPPCQSLKSNLIACYRANPGESLKCSEEVNAFTNCISENRVKKLDDAEKLSLLKSSTSSNKQLTTTTNNPLPKAA